MAKKLNLLKTAILTGAILAPVAGVYASSVKVSVSVAAVAEIANIVEKPTDFGGTEYEVTVKTNSIHGYKLYVSSNGEDWSLIKTFEGYPEGDDLKGTVKTTGGHVEFKVEPIE